MESWIHDLPDAHSPAWLGLPVQAESLLKSTIGQKTLTNLAQLQGVERVNVVAVGDKITQQSRGKGILENADKWLVSLPLISHISSLAVEESDPAMLTSLQRCLLREVVRGKNILMLVKKDLELVKYAIRTLIILLYSVLFCTTLMKFLGRLYLVVVTMQCNTDISPDQLVDCHRTDLITNYHLLRD